MTRRKLHKPELMKVTEKLLLEQGYGGFNFSTVASLLNIGRTTLYEYYASKDELIVDYMNELMEDYTGELSVIVSLPNAKTQLIQLVELMVKYAHIHNVLKVIPLLQNDSEVVTNMKKNFLTDHVDIINDIQSIIDNGKQKNVVRKEIPTDVLVNLLFNTINKPTSLKMDNKEWSKWIWEIIFVGMEA